VRGTGHAYAVDVEAARRVAALHWAPSNVPIQVSPEMFVPARSVAITVKRPTPPVRERAAKARPTGAEPKLPQGWRSVSGMARAHGVTTWDNDWKEAVARGELDVHEGAWRHGGSLVNHALDEGGQAQWVALFMGAKGFHACSWAECSCRP
jgi:hypothetical protein